MKVVLIKYKKKSLFYQQKLKLNSTALNKKYSEKSKNAFLIYIICVILMRKLNMNK